MVYVRFPVPEFDHKQFAGMDWRAPEFLPPAGMERLADGRRAGDASVYGCYPVMPSDDFFARLDVQGEHRHAVMCVLPDGPVHVLGRSYAWYLQRAVIVDSLDAGSLGVVADWRTGRPMSTRLGPTDGATIDGGIVYVVSCRGYDDHWIGNRTILGTPGAASETPNGCRILSACAADSEDFHDCNLSFDWDG